MATRYIIRHRRPQEPVVWIVDSQQWPRACLRAELIERGYDVYGFITIEDALNTLSGGDSPKPDALVFELRDQSVSKQVLDSAGSLHIPTILLGGAAELNDPLIQERQWSAVLKRPVSLGDIADRVQKLVTERRA
jgi:hypothetical protein